jgi:ketosteroid isomerase-like protein
MRLIQPINVDKDIFCDICHVITPTQNKIIAMQWFEAFNANDLEKLLALYANDAQHFSPKLKERQPASNGLIIGKEALRAWWQDAFKRLPSLTYEVLKLTADEEQVFMEYIRHVDGELDLKVGEVLEIKGGQIIASRVYHG